MCCDRYKYMHPIRVTMCVELGSINFDGNIKRKCLSNFNNNVYNLFYPYGVNFTVFFT